jgi:ribosomal protein L7/L12
MANIRLIVEALIGLSVREAQGLAKVLKDEYGIVADAEAQSKDDMIKSSIEVSQAEKAVFEKEKTSKRSKIYVPRVVGKPCRPFVMRRK